LIPSTFWRNPMKMNGLWRKIVANKELRQAFCIVFWASTFPGLLLHAIECIAGSGNYLQRRLGSGCGRPARRGPWEVGGWQIALAQDGLLTPAFAGGVLDRRRRFWLAVRKAG
ncbi:MAG: hypothetical protein WBE41_18755, partial [Terracidiphilus sp.]